ncbi:MAG: hypothetical protein A3H69_04875 [Candidatus Sungbacteria bacterium RIFCSPLOWO2_02_FULL_47_9]|uniref:Aspartate aminotransferase family protein n=1 Tax=Candidatus Sungbacteria bacterium RIFCSPHIGHO2_01_FULL_47_32 TaxID=1802264 RepID=A0A1G2K9C3_9BACT|nr:MAG: Pyridoxal phosphate-dependent aminotransferase, class III family [Parcubacteria group bacterium GW2011_GWA2_47_10]OGZ95985.1 MAG: hypothetical protein A2633_01515 [Candidatus Sungbacteria bacterium RIFCSPHIGHO2_01_FULL_47_32]OGZ98120.1 MAG: hypothetical protein A3D57_00595 [Candidatus Sungbacteria bacterium RIFCSPHIGHO2_02_FULL_46_12]OHA06092.1 MAG: hypothetical protein A3A28_03595 [Candidatus Sungbacteria bacterium RIFCSPLOWO2_01_FULL_47_32]OHA11038.1 MAG: hypothetical protein A3H69_04
METAVFESSDDFSQKYYTERHKNLIAPSTLDPKLNRVIARTKGTRVWDESRKEYIDFNASVGTSGVGHCHPKMLEMLRKQLEIIDFIEPTGFNHRIRELKVAGKEYEISLVALAKTLLPLMFPDTSLSLLRMIPEVTGAQAVNAAVKLFLKANPGKYHFLGFRNAFDGRHGFSLDFTNSKPIQKQDYPSSGIVVHYLPFPDSYENLEEAKSELSNIPLKNVSAFLGEYLQGEGGFKWPVVAYMDEFLGFLRDLGIRIAIDEIQSGLGRTGKWFAWQHGTVTPDVVIAGKALGGGAVPMSAVGYNRELFNFKDTEVLETGWHSGTFPGYITAVAGGIMFLDIMKEEKVLENVILRSAELYDVLRHHSGEPDSLTDYCKRTGFGFMQGLVFRQHDSKPYPEWRNTVLKNLREAEPVGILTLPAGNDKTNPTIRFEPCLIAPESEMEYLDDTLTKVLYKK